MFRSRHAISALLAIAVLLLAGQGLHAAIILGTGTGSLLGNDLTDRDDIHNEGAYNPPIDFGGIDATFDASEEPSFGGGENAFNVFDNLVGGGNDKWCCGDQNNFPTNPIWVQATFEQPFFLTHFTIASGNDTDARRPRVWELQGSNDGVNFDTIFSQNDPSSPVWTAHNQVIVWDDGSFDADPPDFPMQVVAYDTFRLYVTATGATSGARFQLGEIELFGRVPEPSTCVLALLGLPGLIVGGRLTRRRRERRP